MHRTLAVTIAVAVALVAQSPARTARAGTAETIEAAQGWWDQLLNSDALPVPSKKAPLHYGVFPYAAEPCGVFDARRVDKVTSKKPYRALSACLAAAIGAEEAPELTWELSDVDSILIGFESSKQAKAIRKATGKLAIVSLEVRGTEDAAAVHVFFAVDKKGAVRGVYMYVDAAG